MPTRTIVPELCIAGGHARRIRGSLRSDPPGTASTSCKLSQVIALEEVELDAIQQRRETPEPALGHGAIPTEDQEPSLDAFEQAEQPHVLGDDREFRGGDRRQILVPLRVANDRPVRGHEIERVRDAAPHRHHPGRERDAPACREQGSGVCLKSGAAGDDARLFGEASMPNPRSAREASSSESICRPIHDLGADRTTTPKLAVCFELAADRIHMMPISAKSCRDLVVVQRLQRAMEKLEHPFSEGCHAPMIAPVGRTHRASRRGPGPGPCRTLSLPSLSMRTAWTIALLVVTAGAELFGTVTVWASYRHNAQLAEEFNREGAAAMPGRLEPKQIL